MDKNTTRNPRNISILSPYYDVRLTVEFTSNESTVNVVKELNSIPRTVVVNDINEPVQPLTKYSWIWGQLMT